MKKIKITSGGIFFTHTVGDSIVMLSAITLRAAYNGSLCHDTCYLSSVTWLWQQEATATSVTWMPARNAFCMHQYIHPRTWT